MTLTVTAHGDSRDITDLELVRSALVEAGFPPHKPTDEWIRYWLRTDASLEAIIRIAIGRAN